MSEQPRIPDNQPRRLGGIRGRLAAFGLGGLATLSAGGAAGCEPSPQPVIPTSQPAATEVLPSASQSPVPEQTGGATSATATPNPELPIKTQEPAPTWTPEGGATSATATPNPELPIKTNPPLPTESPTPNTTSTPPPTK